MDKLELDDRVARLERRVSILSVLLAVLIAGALIAAMLMTARLRASYEVAMPAAVNTATVRPSTPAPLEFEAELRKARQMQVQGLITRDDFDAKKESILGAPMTFPDEIEAMKTAKALTGEGTLTAEEYEVMKRKILNFGK